MTLGDAPLESFGERWYVAQVHTREEKDFARELIARCVPYFLPLHIVETIVDGRKRTSYRAVFSGYAFFNGGDGERYKVIETNKVVSIIPVLGCAMQQQLRDELAELYNGLVQSGQKIAESGELKFGTVVRIRQGPLMGKEGVVEPGGNRVLISLRVTMLGQSVSVEVNRDWVEAA